MPMNGAARKALEQSIAHWKRLAKATTPREVLREGWGPSHCPLCRLFILSDVEPCRGCPVQQYTDKPGCRGTPYPAAGAALTDYINAENLGVTPTQTLKQFPAAKVQAELDFLRSLLPSTVKDTDTHDSQAAQACNETAEEARLQP